MTPKRTRKLRARAATMNIHEEDFEDQGPEPNMKLSHAFLVVLLLHVIAVGGLYAFNRMKAEKKGSDKNQIAASSSQGEKTGGNQGKNAPEDPEDGGKTPAVAKAPEQARPEAGEAGSKHPQDSGKAGNKGVVSGILKKVAAGGVAVTAGKASGQTNGPDTATQPAVPAPEKDKYTVHAGDTMTKIAANLGIPIPELEKANNMTGNSNLQVGQVLKVPVHAPQTADAPGVVEKPAADEAKGTEPSGVSAPSPVAAAGEYTVVKGDNPYKIAKKFKVTPDELMKANGISDPKKIQIGQKLVIPAPTGKRSK